MVWHKDYIVSIQIKTARRLNVLPLIYNCMLINLVKLSNVKQRREYIIDYFDRIQHESYIEYVVSELEHSELSAHRTAA